MHEHELDFEVFKNLFENISKDDLLSKRLSEIFFEEENLNDKCTNCKYSARTHGEDCLCMKSKPISIDADEVHCNDYRRDTKASKYIKELPEDLIIALPYLETLIETKDEHFEDMKGFINYFKNNIC